MVKVALDVSCLALNPMSGLSEVTRNLVRFLPLVMEQHQIVLFTNYFRKYSRNADFLFRDIRHCSLRVPRRLVDWWWRYNWPALDVYLKGVDVFHGLHIQVPPTKHMRTVLTVHDCRYLAFPELYAVGEVEQYRRQMMTSLSRVDQVATVSEFTRQELLTHFSFPEDRVRVIHNGFSLEHSRSPNHKNEAAGFLERTGLSQPYFLFLGVLDPRKNLHTLIQALTQCWNMDRDFPGLLLVGIAQSDWEQSSEAAGARAQGVIDYIHVGGLLKKDLVWGLIQHAMALCYPSRYEGFGFPPLEAMSMGVPVLAGRCSSIPEVTGKAACLVDPLNVDEMANGLQRLAGDSAYRAQLVALGYQQITRFPWNKTVKGYAALYDEVATS